MPCRLCDLGEHAFAQMLPVGSPTPDVYALFDKPTDDEARFGNLLAGSRGQYLVNTLASVGVSELRAFSVIRCPCDRTPNDDEIGQCMKFVRADLLKSRPKVILTVGGFATQTLLGTDDRISNVHGSLKSVEIQGVTFKVLPVYSPTYVLGNYGNGQAMGEFMNDVAIAGKIVTGEYVSPMDRNVIEYALDYQTFEDFYERNLKGEELLAYDIETNARLVYRKDFEIVGWSLAKEGVGIYVCLDALDYHMPDDDQRKCIDLLIRILQDTPKIVVHNGLYERPATYFRYGYEIPFDKLEDTLVMAKIMLGGKIGAGLKPNARRIGYPEWDADVATYIDSFTKATKRCSLKRNAVITDMMREGKTFEEVFDELDDRERYGEIEGYYKALKEVTNKYYTDEETESLMPMVSRRFVEGYDGGWTTVIPYSWIPQRMLCAYGATDSLATMDLYHHFLKRFDEDSTDEVDLRKGYYYDLMEHYTGYELMLAGIHWDDDSAARDYRVYVEMATKSLRALILTDHPAMREQLLKAFLPEFAPPIVYEYYNDWFWDRYKRRLEMKDEKSFVMIQENPDPDKPPRKRNPKFLFEGIDEIPDTIKGDLMERILPEAVVQVSKMDVEELKEVFNPSSPLKKVADVYSSIVLDDDLRVGCFLGKVRDMILGSEGFDLSKRPESERGLLGAISEYVSVPTSDLDERRRLYGPLKEEILSLTRVESRDLQECLGEMRNLHLDKMAEEFQLLVYDSLKMTPMDPDDPATWTEPFRWNFLLRIYKKSTKIITSYLDGTVGRQSVYAVDKERLRAGEDIVYRETPLVELGTTDYKANLPEGKDWLEQTSFGVGTAETGRWRCLAGDTRIPLLDGRTLTIREIYESGMRDFYVYSYDHHTNRVVPGYCKYAHVTGRDADVVDVLLDNGETVRCTPNHRFLLSDGHTRLASELLPGDSLLRLERDVDDDGYEVILHPCGDAEQTHHIVMADKMGGDYTTRYGRKKVCHHKDLNKRDNDPRNLVLMTGDDDDIDDIDAVGAVRKVGDGSFGRGEVFARRVISVTPSGKEGEVYCLTVERYHNFALAAGVFCKNSAIHVVPEGSTVKRLLTSRFVGGTVFQPDFSANELRCVASLAHEENMLQAFREGLDIHRSNAARLFKVPIEEVTPFQRRRAKAMCLIGDTRIRLLSGVSKTIEELYSDYLDGTLDDYVYSYNSEVGKIIPCKILGVQQNREESEYVEVTLDDGNVIKATTDHPFVLRDGTSRFAEDLVPEDSLMGTYFRDSVKEDHSKFDVGEGYEMFVDVNGETVPTYRRVAEFVEIEQLDEGGTVIHHADFDKRNNHPSNLKLVSASKHMSYQSKSEYIIAQRIVHEELSRNLDRYADYREYNSSDHTAFEEYMAEVLVANYRHKDRVMRVLRDCDPEYRSLVSALMNDKTFIDTVNKGLERSYHTIKTDNGFYVENSKSIREWSQDRRKRQAERVKESEAYKNAWVAKHVRYIKTLLDNGLEVNQENFDRFRPNVTYFKYENLEELLGMSVDELIGLAGMLPNQGKGVSEMDTSAQSAHGIKHMNDLWHSDSEKAVAFREHHSKVHKDMMTDMNRNEDLKLTRNRNKVMKVLRDMLDAGITEDEILSDGMSASFDRLCEISGKSYRGYPRRIGKYFDSLEEAVEAAKTYNHRVISVRLVKSEKPIKFYGMMVNYCHNFLVDLGDDSGVFVLNSFMTLYGGSAASLAQSYLNGDMKAAQEQLDNFYGAFPSLKKWMDSKQSELLRTHKVSTLTQRFINIDFDPNDKKSVSRALRQSVNFPVQSFCGSTEVIGLDGKAHAIKDLADGQEDLWVYSYDIENDRIVPVKGIQAQCTGETDTWYEIVIDNGESVKVTPEHLMMLRSGTYRRADELKIGDSLMPLYLTKDTDNNLFTNDRLRFDNDHNPELIQHWVHDSVYGYVKGTGVHHINIDVDDNRPENLLRLRNAYHIAYHRNFYEYCAGTKTFEDFISVIKDEVKRNYPDRYKERIEDIRNICESMTEEQKRELSKRSMTSRNSRRNDDYPEWAENQRESAKRLVESRVIDTGNVLGMDADEYSRKLSENWANNYDHRIQRLKEGHNTPEARANHSRASKKLQKDPDFRFKRMRTLIGFILGNDLPWETPDEWDASVRQCQQTHIRVYSSSIIKTFGSWDDFVGRVREYKKTFNHKVTDIIVHHLDVPEKKYDLHVPKYHNFALSCGVFTHNSAASTMAAVVFCDILLHMKENGFKSKGICFIHDSLESDVYPYELIEMIEYQRHALATGAVDYFGIECKADVSMGYSMGHECEMTDFEVLDDERTRAYITLDGFYDDILDTINNWKLAYHRVEIVEEDLEDVYLSISEMFIARKAFDPTAMNHHRKGSVKVYIQYYDDEGRVSPMADSFEPIDIWEKASVYRYVHDLPY